MITIILNVVLMAIFFTHNYILLKVLNNIFDIEAKQCKMIILSVSNVVVNIWLKGVFPDYTLLAYLILTTFHFIQVYVYINTPRLIRVGIGLMFPVHIMANSFLVCTICAYITKQSYSYIYQTETIFLATRLISVTLLIVFVAILALIRKDVLQSILKKHPERLKIFAVLELLMMMQLMGTVHLFTNVDYNIYVITTVLITSILMLGIFYTGLFMLIGFDILEEHKIHSNSGILESMYRNMLIEKSERTIEIDCYTGKVINHVFQGEVQHSFIGTSYDKLIQSIVETNLHPGDKELFLTKHELEYMILLCDTISVSSYECEYRLRSAESEYFWYKDTISVQHHENGQDITAIILTNNIQTEKNLAFWANIDRLSGLYNKIATEELIREHLKQHCYGIMFMIDIDNFKAINDNFGHDIGDEVIKEISTKLSCIFKSGDIIGRMGGDEFMVFIKNEVPLNLVDKAIKICESVYTTYFDDSNKITISASIGISEVTEKVCTFQSLYKMADMALYESKKRGKNTYTIGQTKL
ncbi:MAG: hypothetical protein BEN18_10730 [Epulopiscium sp. Nuni2H_MBin001]|nr:MAG: hypothetical protein BEN18_10730 [Epulopiscium sp. Nuni2H_MBin001]